MSNHKGIATIALLIIFGIVITFVFFGVSAVVSLINSNQSLIEDTTEDLQEEQANQMTSDYPDLYAQAGLPEYPNGELVDKRQGRNLNDGVQVTVETSDSIATIKSFFDTEMTNRSFALPSAVAENEMTYFGIYTKGNKKFTLSITKINDTSNNKIHINYAEL